MFYSYQLLCARDARFSVIWKLALSPQLRLPKKQALEINITDICSDIITKIPRGIGRYTELQHTFSLYLLSQLMYGTIRLFDRQTYYLEQAALAAVAACKRLNRAELYDPYDDEDVDERGDESNLRRKRRRSTRKFGKHMPLTIQEISILHSTPDDMEKVMVEMARHDDITLRDEELIWNPNPLFASADDLMPLTDQDRRDMMEWTERASSKSSSKSQEAIINGEPLKVPVYKRSSESLSDDDEPQRRRPKQEVEDNTLMGQAPPTPSFMDQNQAQYDNRDEWLTTLRRTPDRSIQGTPNKNGSRPPSVVDRESMMRDPPLTPTRSLRLGTPPIDMTSPEKIPGVNGQQLDVDAQVKQMQQDIPRSSGGEDSSHSSSLTAALKRVNNSLDLPDLSFASDLLPPPPKRRRPHRDRMDTNKQISFQAIKDSMKNYDDIIKKRKWWENIPATGEKALLTPVAMAAAELSPAEDILAPWPAWAGRSYPRELRFLFVPRVVPKMTLEYALSHYVMDPPVEKHRNFPHLDSEESISQEQRPSMDTLDILQLEPLKMEDDELTRSPGKAYLRETPEREVSTLDDERDHSKQQYDQSLRFGFGDQDQRNASAMLDDLHLHEKQQGLDMPPPIIDQMEIDQFPQDERTLGNDHRWSDIEMARRSRSSAGSRAASRTRDGSTLFEENIGKVALYTPEKNYGKANDFDFRMYTGPSMLEHLQAKGGVAVKFSTLVNPRIMNNKQAARGFYTLLDLLKEGSVHVMQEEPYGEIIIDTV